MREGIRQRQVHSRRPVDHLVGFAVCEGRDLLVRQPCGRLYSASQDNGQRDPQHPSTTSGVRDVPDLSSRSLFGAPFGHRQNPVYALPVVARYLASSTPRPKTYGSNQNLRVISGQLAWVAALATLRTDRTGRRLPVGRQLKEYSLTGLLSGMVALAHVQPLLLSEACITLAWRGASALNIAQTQIGTPLQFFRVGPPQSLPGSTHKTHFGPITRPK